MTISWLMACIHIGFGIWTQVWSAYSQAWESCEATCAPHWRRPVSVTPWKWDPLAGHKYWIVLDVAANFSCSLGMVHIMWLMNSPTARAFGLGFFDVASMLMLTSMTASNQSMLALVPSNQSMVPKKTSHQSIGCIQPSNQSIGIV